ncbi:MAG TPA: protein translocase subunit SecD [Thermoanaerobaculia bacterium]|nr:protein translocase subunit SecD [Thermoanaerobaculia bacterium]
MNRSLWWKIAAIVVILVAFIVVLIPGVLSDEPIRRGLDLKGGTHLVMRVNVGDALRLEVDQASEALKSQAAKNNLPVPTARRLNDTTFIAVPPAGISTAEYERLAKDYLPSFDLSRTPEGALQFKMKAASAAAIERDTIDHAVETIRNRVDALGVTEPLIAPESGNRIVIQLPGVDDPARVKDIIKTTAQLQFRLVEGNPTTDQKATLESVPANMKNEVDILPGTATDELGRAAGVEWYAIRKTVPVSGTDLKNARVQKGRLGEPNVGFSLTPDGGRKFGDLTGPNVGRRLAIVLDNKVMSAPRINNKIEDQGVIEGSFTTQQAADLALVLRSGSLPASLTTLEERTVGPSLGKDSIRSGVLAAGIGFIALILAVVFYYHGAGINAVLALLLNLVIILGMMAIFKATLTLPGIAGIILTLGMAIDSNVLVFERIREELRDGKTVRAAIENGFTRAFGTIIDTHMTTIISALFLLEFGTGPIKGFAVTLLTGLFASVFTAFFVSRVIFDFTYKPQDRPQEISI